MRSASIFVLTILLAPFGASAQRQATASEVASFWNTVFNGPSPHGVPPLNASRTNRRTVGRATVWDVTFDSYRDPDTNTPVRLFGYFAIPLDVPPPGPGGSWPGIVNTHSVGGCATCGSPREGLDTAVFYAEQGYAALAFFLRGYPPSNVSDPALNPTTSTVAFCTNMTGDGAEPFDTLWAGYPVDIHQAAELMAAQPEVWDENDLAFIGHSLGGYTGVMAGIFSERYGIIAASAPPTTGADVPGWIASGNPITSCVDRLPGSMATNRALAVRMVSYIGVHQAINNPALYAIDPTWRLDGAEIFFYGGEVDPAVPPAGVEETYLLADPSNNRAFHWSPTGGHGGPESYDRSRAWLSGHYPGRAPNPPTAALTAMISGLTVTFSAAGSTDDDTMIAWDYDFGDGARRNWGDSVSHTYASAGNYTATVTVTDGEGRRDTASVSITVGGAAAPEISIDAPSPFVVPEGGAVPFDVSLTARPGRTVTVSIARESGDADLAPSSSTLTFTDADWNVPQSVLVSAAADADDSSDAAVLALSATGIPTVRVDVVEADDDGAFEVSIGSAAVAAGEPVAIEIAVTNVAGARIDAFSFTIEFDPMLGDPTMARGAGVPEPALWTFGATIPSPGMQSIAGSQIAQPEGAIIDGVVAIDTFDVPIATVPGTYTLRVVATDFAGRAASETIDGAITVLPVGADAGRMADAGSEDAGSEDAGAPDAGPDRVPAAGGCGCRVGGGSPPAWAAIVALLAGAIARGSKRARDRHHARRRGGLGAPGASSAAC